MTFMLLFNGKGNQENKDQKTVQNIIINMWKLKRHILLNRFIFREQNHLDPLEDDAPDDVFKHGPIL